MTADPYTRARTRVSWVDSVSIRDIPASTDSSHISQSRLFDQVFLSREGKLLGRLMTTNYFSKEPTLVDFVMALAVEAVVFDRYKAGGLGFQELRRNVEPDEECA